MMPRGLVTRTASDTAGRSSATNVPAISRVELLRALVDIAGRVAIAEEGAREADRRTSERIADDLRALLESATELLEALRALDERENPGEIEVATDDWWGDRDETLSAPRISDLCFAGALDLRRVHRQVVEARDPEELSIVAEAARRKLSRNARAVLGAAREGDVPVDSIVPPGGAEEDLHSGLAVRRLYQRFRRALRKPNDQRAESVLEALRYAAGALGTLFADPVYMHVRASDRALLRRMHARILVWAREDRPLDVGLQLLEDVRTYSDLLRGINGRQELRAHDSALCRALRSGPGQDPTAFALSLEDLLGLDDRLDTSIEAWRTSATPATTETLLARLMELDPG